MSLTKVSVEVADDLLGRLDERAAREGRSRSALIRDAIKSCLYDEERNQIAKEIIESYERIPPSEAEMKIAETSAREPVEEESW